MTLEPVIRPDLFPGIRRRRHQDRCKLHARSAGFPESVGDSSDHREIGVRFYVVAEGVETVEQLSWLRSNGIAFAQGYLLGKPGEDTLFSQLEKRQLPAPAADLPKPDVGLTAARESRELDCDFSIL
jgi:hypothetical protein